MKAIAATIGLVMALCSCAGANANDKTTVFVSRSNDPEYVGPKNDLTLDAVNIRDNTVQTVPMDPKVEEANYYHSVNHIIDIQKAEYLQLTMCSEVHGNSSYCKDLNKKLCGVDELIDTRGDIHRKPYCSSRLDK
jgi:hypothetical protein